MYKLYLLLAIVLFSSKSDAEVLVSGGITSYMIQSDGFWYQSAFPYSIQRNTPAGSIGIYSPSRDGWQLGISYTHLGHISSSALAIASDHDYSNSRIWPLSHWYGSGYVHGIDLTAKKTFSSGVFIEGGMFISKPHWHVDVPDWYRCSTTPIDACNIPDVGPTGIVATHTPKIQYSPTLSVGYNLGEKAFLALRIHQTSAKGDSYPAIYKAYSPTISLGFRF